MADLIITPSALPTPSGGVISVVCGETIAAGAPFYLDATTGKALKSDANAVGKKTVRGIILENGVLDQTVNAVISGTLLLNAVVTVGTIYVLSGNPGGIAPAADLTSGWDTVVIGVGLTTTSIGLILYSSGAAVP